MFKLFQPTIFTAWEEAMTLEETFVENLEQQLLKNHFYGLKTQ